MYNPISFPLKYHKELLTIHRVIYEPAQRLQSRFRMWLSFIKSYLRRTAETFLFELEDFFTFLLKCVTLYNRICDYAAVCLALIWLELTSCPIGVVKKLLAGPQTGKSAIWPHRTHESPASRSQDPDLLLRWLDDLFINLMVQLACVFCVCVYVCACPKASSPAHLIVLHMHVVDTGPEQPSCQIKYVRDRRRGREINISQFQSPSAGNVCILDGICLPSLSFAQRVPF